MDQTNIMILESPILKSISFVEVHFYAMKATAVVIEFPDE
jgi:hypothetical protein